MWLAGGVELLAFAPDGRRLDTRAAADLTAWDVTTRQPTKLGLAAAAVTLPIRRATVEAIATALRERVSAAVPWLLGLPEADVARPPAAGWVSADIRVRPF